MELQASKPCSVVIYGTFAEVTGYISPFLAAKPPFCSTHSLAYTPRGCANYAEYKTENHTVT